ncbi:hypothetical protein HDU96_000316 [Phlyctochytrium bullatum]|nr:hypothetical protein HDU96_000316 [Phlyctochytrium bullatum]
MVPTPTSTTSPSVLDDLPPNSAFHTSPHADHALIYTRTWLPPSHIRPVALVLAFHGLGEHINRHAHVFDAFAAAGIVVRGLDYRGHGRTLKRNAGMKPGYTVFEEVWEDALSVVGVRVEGVPEGLPLFVYGHSLGGLLALSIVHHHASRLPNFRGVIAQSPALAPATPIFPPLKLAARLLGPSILPTLSAPNGLDAADLCTSPAVVAAYHADKLVHETATLRLAREIVVYGEGMRKDCGAFKPPALVMCFSKEDKMTCCEAGRKFVEGSGCGDKTFRQFEGVGHELHNEPSIKDELIAFYVQWIVQRASKPVAVANQPAVAVQDVGITTDVQRTCEQVVAN